MAQAPTLLLSNGASPAQEPQQIPDDRMRQQRTRATEPAVFTPPHTVAAPGAVHYPGSERGFPGSTGSGHDGHRHLHWAFPATGHDEDEMSLSTVSSEIRFHMGRLIRRDAKISTAVDAAVENQRNACKLACSSPSVVSRPTCAPRHNRGVCGTRETGSLWKTRRDEARMDAGFAHSSAW